MTVKPWTDASPRQSSPIQPKIMQILALLNLGMS